MYTVEDINKAKQYLSEQGYGTGSNFTLNTVANLMAEWLVKNCFIPDVSNLLCGSFEPDNKTSSATRCKCGREKWEHPMPHNCC